MDIAKIPAEGILSGGNWGDLFFHPRFVNTAGDLFHLEGEPLILSAKGLPVFALDLLRHKTGPVRSASIPLLFQYFGVIALKTDISENDFIELNDYIGGFCDYAIFSFPPGFPVELLKATGWRLTESITLALYDDDLRTWGENFRDDVKNKIRKAEKSSVEVVEADTFPEELWEQAYTRKNLHPPLDPSLLARWCDRLISDSLLRIFIARIGKTPVAFRGELIYGDYAYDWIAGSDPEYHATGANQLLMSEIGNRIALSGVKTWDLVGGQIKSIYDFKKSFGARDLIYYQGEKRFNIKGTVFSYLRKLKYGR